MFHHQFGRTYDCILKNPTRKYTDLLLIQLPSTPYYTSVVTNIGLIDRIVPNVKCSCFELSYCTKICRTRRSCYSSIFKPSPMTLDCSTKIPVTHLTEDITATCYNTILLLTLQFILITHTWPLFTLTVRKNLFLSILLHIVMKPESRWRWQRRCRYFSGGCGLRQCRVLDRLVPLLTHRPVLAKRVLSRHGLASSTGGLQSITVRLK